MDVVCNNRLPSTQTASSLQIPESAAAWDLLQRIEDLPILSPH
jgi:hypothetical protein